MSDSVSSHDEWLLRLKNHLREERYRPGYAGLCMAGARNFVAFLRRENIAITDTQPATVESYLKVARPKYRRRNGHSTAYDGWSRSQRYAVTAPWLVPKAAVNSSSSAMVRFTKSPTRTARCFRCTPATPE